MSKRRIHELAKEKKWPVKAVLAIAQKEGMDIKNAMSSLNEDQVKKLESLDKKITSFVEPAAQTKKPVGTQKTSVESVKIVQPIVKERESESPQLAKERLRSGGRPQTNNRPAGDRPQYNNNRPAGDRPQYNNNRPAGDRPQYNNNRPAGDRPQYNNNRPAGDRPQYNNNRPAGDRPQYNNNRPAGDRPQYNNNRPAGDRPQYNNNRPAGDRPQYNNNRPAGDRPQYNNNRPAGRNFDKSPSGFNKDKDATPMPTPATDSRRFSGKQKKKPNRMEEIALSHKKRKEEQKREADARRKLARAQELERIEALKNEARTIKYKDSLTIGEFSQLLGVGVSEIIKYLFGLGIMASVNQTLDPDVVELVAAEYNASVEREVSVDEADLELFFDREFQPEDFVERAPVVTIMGHVDHGKTTLLDAIRKTKVVDGEAGGITQHIGAYQVEVSGKPITFLDTPGHEAFTKMRARGAQITDIAVIVVAGDDGVMPQTREAVEHAKAANVPIVIAVNKMDKQGVNPDRVMQELTELEIVSEAWGGDTIFANISAITGQGIPEFLETITLLADVQELKAVKETKAMGTVIEARLDRGKGVVATLLVQTGTLNKGDAIVAGTAFGRVRTMETEFGERLNSALPSAPVEITGLNAVPTAGDRFVVFENEKKARAIGEERVQRAQSEQRRQTAAMTLEDLNQQIQEGNMKEINVIIKADVQGSAEAVAQSFKKIDVDGARVRIIRSAVGAITESDVNLALASNAIIYGFNVKPDSVSRQSADREGVEIRLHTVIYRAIEELEQAMFGMLDPEYEEQIIGQAEIKETFKVSKVGTIAGAFVTEGMLSREASVRLIREGIIIFDGKLGSLKRYKDDAKEVKAGIECGFTIERYNDMQAGDIVEAYIMKEIKRKMKKN